MGLASFDTWVRVLFFPPARIQPRYWLRLASALATSALATLLVLPERLALGLRRRSGRRRPEVVVVLGYYRSGTTHLHYLLNCDPRFRAPTWCETLAPHGYVVSWWFLRWFLVPFLSSKRPQDDVAIGPEWPAEDDFAVCNASGTSSLPGRMIVPTRYDHYARYHALDGLPPRELERWRVAQRLFLWKIATLSGGRTILLKSPSHTARVPELLELIGPKRVRFVHVRRDPEAVIRSNVAMHRRLEPYLLQPAPPDEVVENRVREELARTEAKYVRTRGLIPAGQLSEVTYDELASRPLETARRIYADLGIAWSPEAERRMTAYLESVRDYRPAAATAGPLHAEVPSTRRIPARAWVVITASAIAAAAVWVILAYILRDRSDWFVWPVGIIIGLTALRSARQGSTRLGLAAGAATLLVLLLIAWPATYLSEYYQRNPHPFDVQLPHIWLSTRRGLLAVNNVFWVVMGMLTAYRFASRPHPRPPGR
jgi:hypothetical protein